MLVIGLTGSVAMGKTTTAGMLAAHGLPVYDADAAVHRLYEKGGAAVAPVGELCRSAVVDGAVDRERLAAWIKEKPERLKTIEKIVHPLVARERRKFLAKARDSGAWAAVLDIPLLYETGSEAQMDAVIVATADADTQRRRVLARPGMTGEKFDLILARQMPDADKRARADYLVDTAQGMDAAKEQVSGILADLQRSSVNKKSE